MLIDFSKKVKEIKDIDDKKPKLVTFLGFAGATNCMLEIGRVAGLLNIETIEASAKHPKKFSWWSTPLIKVDAILRKKFKIHLGLSRVQNQAKAAYKTLEADICRITPIILCGHSQGGLVALHFWKQYKNVLNIKGIVVLSSPLKGVTFFQSIASAEKLRKAAKMSNYVSFFKAKVEPCLISWIYFPIFKVFARVFFPSLADFLGRKKFRNTMGKIYDDLKKDQLKVLNITCAASLPINALKLPYSVQAMKMLVAGDLELESDNVLALSDQKFPIKWSNLNEIFIKADHGAFNVPGAPKIFHHGQALDAIKSFIREGF